MTGYRIPDEVLAGSKIVVRVEFECDQIPDTNDVISGLRRATKYIGCPRKVHMFREKDGKVIKTGRSGVGMIWEGLNLRLMLKRWWHRWPA